MRRTIVSAVVLAAAAATALTGCGDQSSGNAASATSSSTAGAASTSTSTSSSVASSTSTAAKLTKPAPGGKVDAKIFADAVWRAVDAEKSYKMTLTRPEEPAPMIIKVDQASGVKLEATADGQTMRLLDGSLYMSIPAADRTDSRSWLGIEKGSKSPLAALMAQSLSMATQLADSAAQRGMVADASVTFVGDEASGAHYRALTPATALVDQMKRAMKNMSPLLDGTGSTSDPSATSSGTSGTGDSVDSMSAEMDKLRSKLAGKKIVVDYWLDARGRPVVCRTDMSQLAAAAAQMSDSPVAANVVESGATTTARYSEWGAKYSITKPPAAEVMPFDEAMSSMSDNPFAPESGSSSATSAR